VQVDDLEVTLKTCKALVARLQSDNEEMKQRSVALEEAVNKRWGRDCEGGAGTAMV
jgi:hypothetical protein